MDVIFPNLSTKNHLLHLIMMRNNEDAGIIRILATLFLLTLVASRIIEKTKRNQWIYKDALLLIFHRSVFETSTKCRKSIKLKQLHPAGKIFNQDQQQPLVNNIIVIWCLVVAS